MIDVTTPEGQVLDPRLDDRLEDKEASDDDFVFCGTCSEVIARRTDATTLHGQFEHYCVNPYGIEFRVGCYREALGCSISGTRNAADTWFAGYQWRLASCEQCQTHLGWYFDNAEHYFYGLILDRIQVG